jgi:hypothetical protein
MITVCGFSPAVIRLNQYIFPKYSLQTFQEPFPPKIEKVTFYGGIVVTFQISASRNSQVNGSFSVKLLVERDRVL